MNSQPATSGPRSSAGDVLTGRSIVAGCMVDPPTQVDPGSVFRGIDPVTGRELPTPFVPARPEDVDAAAWAAWQAFYAIGDRSPTDRAGLLEAIADAVTELGDALIAVASDETGLGPARLVSERDRTVGTLRMFAQEVRAGDWVGATIDTGQPSRRPIPKPDLRRMLRPLGPVAVFGAGNFPLAYSTAGGDTASALAAGCPVVVKGHPGHPGTGELVAASVIRAIQRNGFPPGTFSFLHSAAAGSTREMALGEQLVKHPCIRAVGFTGSFGGGTALARAAASRPDPVPVHAEMGSVNPVFVLPDAAASQGSSVAERLVASITNSNGQMCTRPGLVFGVRAAPFEAFVQALAAGLERTPPQPMLNRRGRTNFGRRADEVLRVAGVELRAGSAESLKPEGAQGPVRAAPLLFQTAFETFRRVPTLHEEVFGPAVIVVVCDGEGQLFDAAASIQGSLTGTIWAGDGDGPAAHRLQAVLEQRVGRLIFNGVPTGVEVGPAMVHGGPFPATNQPQWTAVGPCSIQRWCRPVCYQNAPDAFLPAELRNANPLGIRRLVDGQWTAGPI